MSTISVTTEDGSQIDLEIYEGGLRVLPDTSEDRTNEDLTSIDSGGEREDDEPVDAAHAA